MSYDDKMEIASDVHATEGFWVLTQVYVPTYPGTRLNFESMFCSG